MSSITKAVILAAGYGTRFLPVTKAMPKEMLPVVDKPVIQYVVEDAVAAGVKDVVIVNSSSKRPIEDHFDNSFELETVLEKDGKTAELAAIRKVAEMANFIYVRQKGRRGNLAAFMCGYEAIGNEPFYGYFGDDFFYGEPSRSQQLARVWERYRAPVVGCMVSKNPEDGKRYGFVAGEEVEPGVIKVEKIIEKPGVGQAPSVYATVGGGIFTPDVMNYYDEAAAETEGEVVYVAALEKLIKSGKPVYACAIQGHYYDCGNKLEYIKTIIDLALQNEEMGDSLHTYLGNLK